MTIAMVIELSVEMGVYIFAPLPMFVNAKMFNQYSYTWWVKVYGTWPVTILTLGYYKESWWLIVCCVVISVIWNLQVWYTHWYQSGKMQLNRNRLSCCWCSIELLPPAVSHNHWDNVSLWLMHFLFISLVSLITNSGT